MSNLTLRRSVIIVATMASLFVGAVAIRAAAGWTASVAPLEQPPDPAALVSQLKGDHARADAVADELSQVLGRADELHAALIAAQEKAAADALSAEDLARRLAEASQKLAMLQSQMADAQSQPSAAGGGGEVQHEDEHEDEHEDDD
jgi:hypothetical protein